MIRKSFRGLAQFDFLRGKRLSHLSELGLGRRGGRRLGVEFSEVFLELSFAVLELLHACCVRSLEDIPIRLTRPLGLLAFDTDHLTLVLELLATLFERCCFPLSSGTDADRLPLCSLHHFKCFLFCVCEFVRLLSGRFEDRLRLVLDR